MLVNIKILCFINHFNIERFFEKIKRRFNTRTFDKFFNYFESTYIKGNSIINKFWNYSYYYNLMKNNDKYFFTNNFCESFNRTLNSNFIKTKNNFYKFEECIKSVLIYNKKKDIYKFNNNNITDALYWYTNNNNIKDLLSKEEYIKIKKKYIEFKNEHNNENSLLLCQDIDLENIDNKSDKEFISSAISDSSPSNDYISSSDSGKDERIFEDNNKNNDDDQNNDNNDSGSENSDEVIGKKEKNKKNKSKKNISKDKKKTKKKNNNLNMVDINMKFNIETNFKQYKNDDYYNNSNKYINNKFFHIKHCNIKLYAEDFKLSNEIIINNININKLRKRKIELNSLFLSKRISILLSKFNDKKDK